MTNKFKAGSLALLSPEERAAMRLKSLESKRLAKEQREANAHLYKTEWADSTYWKELSTKHSLRMPNELTAPTLTRMRKACNKLKVVPSEWLEDCGLTKLQQWLDLNPKHTLYAFCGNILEWKDSKKPLLV